MKEIGKAVIGTDDVTLFLSYYVGGHISVIGQCDDGIPWDTLTRFVDGLKPGEVAVDTSNEWDYPAVLEQTGWFKDTGRTLHSGFCSYPVYLYKGEVP